MPIINDLPLFGLFRKIYIAGELYNRELTSLGDREGIPKEVMLQSEPEDAELLAYSVKHQGEECYQVPDDLSQVIWPQGGSDSRPTASQSPPVSIFLTLFKCQQQRISISLILLDPP